MAGEPLWNSLHFQTGYDTYPTVPLLKNMQQRRQTPMSLKDFADATNKLFGQSRLTHFLQWTNLHWGQEGGGNETFGLPWHQLKSAKCSWVAIPFKTISISIQLQVLGEERSMSFLLCTQAVLSKRSKWSGSQSRDTKTTKVGNESDPSLVQAHRGTPCTKRTSNQGGKGRGVHGGLRTLWRVPNWFPKFLHTTFSVVTAYSNVLTLKTSVSVYHFFVSIFKLDMNGYYTIYSKSTFYKNSGQHWRVNKILFAYQSFTDTVSKSQCFH